ncbi:MAG TPA: hypothetical protein VM012_11440 [Flavitalea sp.]|nr:hypothetical protein [Flavitalea sp.]
MRLSLSILAALTMLNTAAQNIGIGTPTPLSKLHIFTGASGNFGPFSPVVVEGNNNTYINLLTPNAAESGLLFGNAGNAASGGIVYNGSGTPLGFQFRTNGNIARMVLNSNGEVQIGGTTPGATLDVVRGTSDGGTAIFRGTTHVSHFNHSVNEHTYIRAGKNNSFVVLNDIPGGRVGIGYANPNAPLGFAPALGKKITLYPGGSGDIGFAVQGNVLQIYADLPNADVAFGYDQSNVFTERFRMRGNGTFLVNGNAGSPGQVLQSSGEGNPPTWSQPTNLLYSNTIFLDNTTQIPLTTSDFVPIPGLNHTFTVTGNAKVLITFTVMTASGACIGCGSSTMYIDINLDGNLNNNRFIETVANGAVHSFAGTTLLTVGAGTHTIQFLGSRSGSDGYMGHPSQASHAVLQIIPQ